MPVLPSFVQPCYPDDNAYDPSDDYKPASQEWLERLKKDVIKRRQLYSRSFTTPPTLRLVRGKNHQPTVQPITPNLTAVPLFPGVDSVTIFHFGIRCVEKAALCNDGSIERRDIESAIACLQKIKV